MNHYTDKDLANYLLDMRQRNGRGHSWGYLKKYRLRLVLFFGAVIALLGFGAFTQSWWLCGFVLGWVVGIFSRDRAHLRQLQAIWPFYGKVIDWLKVEKIANVEPSA